MRVLIDCNVLVSAARSGRVCARVVVAAVRQHDVVLSWPVVDEYETVAGRLAHLGYRDGLLALIAELKRVATLVEPTQIQFGLRDPDDEVYLQTASAGGAVLVTGNSRDFTQPRYGTVDVYSPRMFVDHHC